MNRFAIRCLPLFSALAIFAAAHGIAGCRIPR